MTIYVPGTSEKDPSKVIMSLQALAAAQATDATSIAAMQAAWTAYTPTVTAQTNTFTSVAATGRYLQTGKTVFFSIQVTITTNGTASGGVNATLPVTARTATYSFPGRETVLTGDMLLVWTPDTSKVRIRKYDNTYEGGDGAILLTSGAYEAA